MSRAERTLGGVRERARRPLLVAFFGVLPVIATAQLLLAAVRVDAFAVDFHHSFRPAAVAVVEGRSPYGDPSPFELWNGTAFPYPPLTAVLLTPFAPIPPAVADALFTALLIAAALIALRVLGVRDLRCYGVAFLWAPVFSAVQTANVTLLLVLGLALLWRYRARAAVAVPAAALLVALKLFLWPLVVWLALTRRYRASLAAGALAVGLTAGAWAVIGFAGLREYPDTVSLLTRLVRDETYTLFTVALALDVAPSAARVLALVAAGAVLAAGAQLARKGRDEQAFALAIAAAVLFSPIVWLHYFALLLVPLAVLRPRFGPLWLLPLTLWICPARLDGPSLLAALPLVVGAVMLLFAFRSRVPHSVPYDGMDRPRRPLAVAPATRYDDTATA